MRVKRWLVIALLCALVFPAMGESAPAARDLTNDCVVKSTPGNGLDRLRDRSSATYFRSDRKKKPYIQATMPENEQCFGIYICFSAKTLQPWQVLAQNGEGEWVQVARGEGKYANEYVSLPGLSALRVVPETDAATRLEIFEIYLFGEGELPASVQRWTDGKETCDLLLLCARPGDELTSFGALIPWCLRQGRFLRVATLTCRTQRLRFEMLDALWTMGARIYPDFGSFEEENYTTLARAVRGWKQTNIDERITGLIRRYRPSVVLTHAQAGEKVKDGEAMACADGVKRALVHAPTLSSFPAQAEQYGVWMPSKLYLHLSQERTLALAYSADDFALAQSAAACYTSVKNLSLDKSPFYGLLYSSVGWDEAQTGLFENVN